MRFEVLGPLRVRTERGELSINASRERALLATLLLHAGSSVSVDRLVDAVWSDAPPTSARNQVQACVSRLRKRLVGAGVSGDIVATDPSGYRIRVDPRSLDLHEFRAWVEQARKVASQGRPLEARDRFRAALALWRGPALADIENADVRRTAIALDEERIQALEECIEAELALGKAGELVGELTELVQQHPYREGFYTALMRALYGAGRSADALATYRRLRRLFHDELGTEPGEKLRQLHQAILNRDPSLLPHTTPNTVSAALPRELPAEASCFVGREREAALLVTALTSAARHSRRRPPTVLLYGPGGVGKSALAVRVAHDVAAAYPDGQLYVDLCGSTPGREPLPAIDVLDRFLRRLGMPPEQIPSDETEAASLFRSVSAERRLLIVLDNAAGKDQVSPLMPGSAACGVVITSRQPLSSLDVDQRLRVGVLADDDALALLSSLADVATADPQAAQAIVALCGGLPLAIRIAAGRLASRPHVSVTEYAQRLADRARRLDELKLDDLAVRACVRTSYEALESSVDPTEQRAAQAFRMLGLLHVPNVASGLVAAMLDEPTDETARAALDRLVDAQLLEPVPGGRYRLHDLVRLVAAETATAHESQRDRDRAVDGAFRYYHAACKLASSVLLPDRIRIFEPPSTPASFGLPTFARPVLARAWMDAELPNVVVAIEQAMTSATTALPTAMRLSEEIWDHLHFRNEWQAGLHVSRLVFRAGQLRNDATMAGWGNLALGRTVANFGDYAAATANFEEALRIFRTLNNVRGTLLTLTALGVVANWRGEPSIALTFHAEAMDTSRRHGVDPIQAAVLLNMSACYVPLGQIEDAIRVAKQCIAVAHRRQSTYRFAAAWNNLAASHCLNGDLSEAVRCSKTAVACAQEAGDQLTQRLAPITRAVAYLWRDDHAAATHEVREVIKSAVVAGDRYAEAAALRLLAKIQSATGQVADAGRTKAQADAAYARLMSRRDPVIETLLAHDGPLRSDHYSAIAPAGSSTMEIARE